MNHETQPSLGLCMIVRDEEKLLPRCLASVQGLADEIVVADTGSVDRTADIAIAHGATVYHIPWEESFAKARNFALGMAKSDWLLLLDADEALDPEGRETILTFIRDTPLDGASFRVHNYTGTYSPDNYGLHSALRLLRNNGQYCFAGDIHEQVVRRDGTPAREHFCNLDVVLHHYGYLTEVLREKHKPDRNRPILARALARAPEDPFLLFSLGNELLLAEDFIQALGTYEQALRHTCDWEQPYAAQLYFRAAICCQALGQYDRALELLKTALERYPQGTDYMYLRAEILFRCRRYTLALESAEDCRRMGAPPELLCFLHGCGGFRAAYLAGKIYLRLEDYKRALYYYSQTLQEKGDHYPALYRMGRCLRRMEARPDSVRRRLFSCFAEPEYPPNLILGADILLRERLYEQVLEVLPESSPDAARAVEMAGLRGLALCCLGRWAEGRPLLEAAAAEPDAPRILGNLRPQCLRMLFVIHLLSEDGAGMDRARERLEALRGRPAGDACRLLSHLVQAAGDGPPPAPADREAREELLSLLELLLRLGRPEFVERLPCLPAASGGCLLPRVARLLWENEYPAQAAQLARRCAREMDCVDADTAELLFFTADTGLSILPLT